MKRITFEQYRKIYQQPLGHFAVSRYDSGGDHLFYLTVDSLDWKMKFALTDIKIAASNFKQASNHVEFLNQDLIHFLEDDNDSRVLCGEMSYSYDYEEYKKSTQKAKNNMSGMKSRAKSKIKYNGGFYRDLVNLKNFVTELTQFVGPLKNEVIAN